MHIALPIGKSNVLMASDVPAIMGQVNENENRSKIAISASVPADSYKMQAQR